MEAFGLGVGGGKGLKILRLPREEIVGGESAPASARRGGGEGGGGRGGWGKTNTLFPLGLPPRIMYQDYPGNFDTSSRGSSGSPAHAESYSSGGGGQQVSRRARWLPGCTWRGASPSFFSFPLCPLLDSLFTTFLFSLLSLGQEPQPNAFFRVSFLRTSLTPLPFYFLEEKGEYVVDVKP